MLTGWNAPIAALASCPGCACDVAIRIAVAYRKAGKREERVGTVLDCVRCGARYTALDAGGSIAYGRGHAGAAHAGTARAGTDRVAGSTTGGAGDGAGASLFADMETLD